jgi:TonB-linked SusC/RagA family outer membrane protein
VIENDYDWRKFQQDYILNYKKNIGDHSLTASAGFTSYYFGQFSRQVKVKQGTTSSDLPIPNDPRFWYISSGFGVVDPSNTNSSQSEYTTASFLGRVMYNYKGKYFLNASYRDDGSSRLVGANRYQQFWALGAAWELTQEGFIQNIKQINFLKIKGSYGILGNQTASQLDGTPINYPSYPNVTTGTKAVFGNSIYNSFSSAYLANPNLKWEPVNASEVGLELDAFDSKLHADAAYFNRTTNNLMTFIDRSSLGLQNELINGGSLRNWGEEISAVWKQGLGNDLRIDVGGNITFLKNKVVSLSPDLPNGFLSRQFMNNGSAESRTMVGQPIASFYGYRAAGLFQSYADILASPIQSSLGAYRPGDLKFEQVSPKDQAEGIVTASSRTVIGNPTPKFTYGMSVNVYYKAFNLSVDMQGVYGNVIFRTWGSLESPYQRVNYGQFMMNRWHGPGTSNWQPIISQADRINYNGSTYNLEDGSYFRFRNVQLGYNFRSSALASMKLTALRIYVNCQNLYTFKHNLGYTPEYGGDATAFGYDNGGGAIPRITSLGVNLTF